MQKVAFWTAVALLCGQAQAQAPTFDVRVKFVDHGAELSGSGLPKQVTCKGNLVHTQIGEMRLVVPELRILLSTRRQTASRPATPPLPLAADELRFSCVAGEIGLSHGSAVELHVEEE